jgi:hypothetical protein
MGIKDTNKIHWLLSGIVLSLVILGVFLWPYIKNSKAFVFPFTAFGGPVVLMIPCTCPTDIGKFIIAIGPPKPGLFIYDFRWAWLTTKMWWRVVYGHETVGLAWQIPPGVCWMYGGTFCVPTVIAPYIFLIGTSGVPL